LRFILACICVSDAMQRFLALLRRAGTVASAAFDTVPALQFTTRKRA
jgi:hypothetical protein